MATWGTRLFAVGCVAVLVVASVFGSGLLALTAPFSGTAWETVDRGERTVETPYGPATVTYVRHGVPHVEADSTEALYFAIGYTQARDRLFQMDLFRRQMAGNLSTVAGEATVESDRFHRQMDFESAAETQWERLQGTEVEEPLQAYTAGVNTYMDRGTLPLEFRLNDYRPTEWTPADTLLVGKRATWGLSGEFSDLRRATVRNRVPNASELYPDQLDHNSSIFELAREGRTDSPATNRPTGATTDRESAADYGALYDSLARYERGQGIGSNNWVVSGNRSATGEPMLANDPHLQLFAPPVWYEMQLSGPETEIRGVAFPGVPMPLIGQTDEVAWGITNVGADVTDLYRYEWRGQQYYHDGEWQNATVETETIDVRDGPDETVEIRKTVHGPVLEREDQTVAVSWLGLTGTREPLAFYGFGQADGMDEFRDSLRNFDIPASSIVAMSDDGQTFYRPSGTYPIRRTNGTVVRGDRVFNGSADEGTWRGFEPYDTSNLTGTGFVDYERVPRIENPEAMGTANQRVADDLDFYLGTSSHFADSYRGQRVDEMLESSLEDGEITREEMRAMQRDTRSLAAEQFVPIALNATDEMSDEARRATQQLDSWDYEMRKGSRAALVYDRWLTHYRNETFSDEFYPNGLDESYYPHDWTLGRLPADSRWFDDRSTIPVETRVDIAARAMNATVEEIDREGWDDYGDVNQLRINHPFGGTDAAAFLNYPRQPMDGGPYTLFNFRASSNPQAGSSWRMIVGPDFGIGVRPGGNIGHYWSDHYVGDDLRRWRLGEYRQLWTNPGGEPDIRFVEGSG
ncbi:penicillin acylase family protein [Halapricum salinum]|uniref:Penicillin acylase family protein n=1 Tax=Halapricum salinum TaxID=1457250 RepID=A0A4D6HGL2_9EURY|nr:penicillin acylase family protein [Halapricum salinum]QCC52366.1 penicillin acylase family protein [Halapricum salinum]